MNKIEHEYVDKVYIFICQMSHLQAGRLNYVLGHRELSLFHQTLDPSNMLHPEMQQSYYDYDEIGEIQMKSAFSCI